MIRQARDWNGRLRYSMDLAERLLEGADAPARLDAGELLELLRWPMG